MMAQEIEGTAEELQVLETTTTEATAEQAESAVAPVVLPPEPTAEVAVEVPLPQLEERLTHQAVAEDHQEVVADKDEKNAFSDELHGNLGEEEGDVEGEFEGEIVSEAAQREKLAQDRKLSRKEAIKKRYSFGLSKEAHSEMEDKDEGEEEEDSDGNKEEYKEEVKVQSFASILDEESEEEGSKLKTRFEESRNEGIFGALPKDTGKGSKEIFYLDPKYDNSEMVSFESLKSAKSPRSMGADTIQMKEDFLRTFEMPSLSDISEEHEPDFLSLDNVSVDSVTQVKGHFTDPLAADYHESSSTASEVASLFDNEDQDDAAAAASPLEISSEFSDIPDLLDSPLNEAPITTKTITFEEIPAFFQEIQIQVHDDDEEGPKKDIGLDIMVQHFMDNLLMKIVTAYERNISDNRLRSMCDKAKLLAELKNITDIYVFERYTNEMLNTRLVEYYRRNRNQRAFAPEDEEKEDNVTRYYEALAKVDSFNLRVDAFKYKYEELVARMKLDLHAVQHFVNFTESRLEYKARKYLVRQDFEFLKRFVDSAMRQMNAKRNEISDMRLSLILKKTTLAELQAKLTELEALSSTVSISDFLHIQNDIINLGKKIEERTVDLNKIRAQYLMDVHITHHNREKALALGDKLTLMKTTLGKAIDKQRSLRASLYSKKLERTRIREKREALTLQGGILAMPALMYEYDKTVEHVKEGHKRVTKLRDTVEALNRRVSLISEIRSS